MGLAGYSAWRLFREGLRGHRGWKPAWADAQPRPRYKVLIIGGGGHGLATAYYLASRFGIRDVAVVEKGWIGGGNTGRNTTVVRSNYFHKESAALYDFSLRQYEGLSQELNYNIMFSQRGMITLAHSPHDVEMLRRSLGAMRLNGIDAEWLEPAAIARACPLLDQSPGVRYPVLGGVAQPRAGTARHDAVAWGYARAASALGVHILQNCGVASILRGPDGAFAGVETTRGTIHADRALMAVAGSSSHLASIAGFRLPVTSCSLQAMVTEPVKPVLDTVVLSPATGLYISQSDKGEIVIGGGIDPYPSYGQRGNLPPALHSLSALSTQYPRLGRLRILRQWAGIVDLVKDSSPILGTSPVPGLLLNCGWGTGGFKAIPVGGYVGAHHLAKGEPHPLAAPFGLERFTTGALIDEAAASGIAH